MALSTRKATTMHDPTPSQPVAIAQAPTRDMVLVVKALENKLKESGAAAA